MSSRRKGNSRTSGSAQRRLDFNAHDTRTSESAILVEDEPPRTRTSRLCDSGSSPQKRTSVTSFESPAPSKKSKVAAVTPEGSGENLSKFVPTYLHKNVEYYREGASKLPITTIEVFNWICDRYEIPSDFEKQRSFGPLSGTTFELRVIEEYTLNKLNRKENAPDAETMICSSCAQPGHVRDDCPLMI